MAEVTQEMILDYLMRKGGVVRNVDLVRHFKKYLQIESALEKGKYEPMASTSCCCTNCVVGGAQRRPCSVDRLASEECLRYKGIFRACSLSEALCPQAELRAYCYVIPVVQEFV